jgi:hypothetical protein
MGEGTGKKKKKLQQNFLNGEGTGKKKKKIIAKLFVADIGRGTGLFFYKGETGKKYIYIYSLFFFPWIWGGPWP